MNSGIDYTLHYETWHDTSQEHLEKMSRFYAKSFDDDFQKISESLGKTLGEMRLLDFGCGMGLFLHHCRKMGIGYLCGFELDEGQSKHGTNLGLMVQQSKDPIEWLKSHTEQYDIISAIDVLEHIPTNLLPDTLRLLRNLLSPNGRFIATVPNANAALAGRWRYIDWTHHTSFSEHSLSHVLRMAGFSDTQVSESEIVRFYQGQPGFMKLATEAAILKCVRFVRKIQYIGELGWDEGIAIPLTTNIKVIACK